MEYIRLEYIRHTCRNDWCSRKLPISQTCPGTVRFGICRNRWIRPAIDTAQTQNSSRNEKMCTIIRSLVHRLAWMTVGTFRWWVWFPAQVDRHSNLLHNTNVIINGCPAPWQWDIPGPKFVEHLWKTNLDVVLLVWATLVNGARFQLLSPNK